MQSINNLHNGFPKNLMRCMIVYIPYGEVDGTQLRNEGMPKVNYEARIVLVRVQLMKHMYNTTEDGSYNDSGRNPPCCFGHRSLKSPYATRRQCPPGGHDACKCTE